jgi:hypothetical protein
VGESLLLPYTRGSISAPLDIVRICRSIHEEAPGYRPGPREQVRGVFQVIVLRRQEFAVPQVCDDTLLYL